MRLAGGEELYDERDQEFLFKFYAETEDGSVKNSDYSLVVKTSFKNSPPRFVDDLTPVIVMVGEKFDWYLPEMTDPDGDEITSVTFMPKLPFLLLDTKSEELMKFKFDGTRATNDNAGVITVVITLKDEYGASSVYKFFL